MKIIIKVSACTLEKLRMYEKGIAGLYDLLMLAVTWISGYRLCEILGEDKK